MTRTDTVGDDLAKAARDLIVDPSKVGDDLLMAAQAAAAGRLFTSAYSGTPGGVDMAKLAGAAFTAKFIEGTVSTPHEQQGNFAAADAAVAKADSLVSSGSADAATIGQLQAAYGALSGFHAEVWAAQGRLSAAIDKVNNDLAKRDAASKLGASASETQGFNTVDDYLAYKKAEKEKRQTIQPA
jgi:hypothetical protein